MLRHDVSIELNRALEITFNMLHMHCPLERHLGLALLRGRG
jgi:hypothetical protein